MLLKTLIQLDGRTYCFLRNLERFSLIFGFFGFTVHSYTHTHALTWCACDNPVCAPPAQKCSDDTVQTAVYRERPYVSYVTLYIMIVAYR